MPDTKDPRKAKAVKGKPVQQDVTTAQAIKKQQAKADMRNGQKNTTEITKTSELNKGHQVGAGRVMIKTTWDRGEQNAEVQKDIRKKFYEEQRLKLQQAMLEEAEEERNKQRNKVKKGGRR